MAYPIIIMGVSGSGKTTIGKLLSEALGMTFHDADDYHPKANKAKMANGEPLNDEDRLPWLHALRGLLLTNPMSVLACSALKESYRLILDPQGEYEWVYLEGDKSLIYERMDQRGGHFMKASMLDSQFEALEVPQEALKISITETPEAMVEKILEAIGQES